MLKDEAAITYEKMKKIDLNIVAKSVVDDFNSIYNSKRGINISLKTNGSKNYFILGIESRIEQIIANLRINKEIKHFFSSINTTYNCGLTHFDLRYENAKKPLNVCSFKPSEKKAWDKFEKVVNPNIIKHFKKHELL